MVQIIRSNNLSRDLIKNKIKGSLVTWSSHVRACNEDNDQTSDRIKDGQAFSIFQLKLE
jgi:hypothetical protein